MWIERFFQVFILILTVAFIGSCGVSNENSIGNLPTIRIDAKVGGNESFTTSDGVKVTVEVPKSDSGEIVVGEAEVKMENDPVISKVSNGVSIIINSGIKSESNQTTFAKVTLSFPANLEGKINPLTVRLYKVNKDSNSLEIYPCSIKNGTVEFEVRESGTFILLDNKLVPIPQLQTQTRDVGYELPSTPLEVRYGPIKLNYPITKEDNIIIKYYLKEHNIVKEGSNTITVEGIKYSIYSYVDGVYVEPTVNVKTETEGDTEKKYLEITIPKQPAGKHSLTLEFKKTTQSKITVAGIVGPIEITNKFPTLSTFFIVQSLPYSLDNEEIELLRKYSPVVEFGNYENLPYWQDECEEWYGDFKEEYYLPIDLADLKVCKDGQAGFDYESLANYLPYWLTAQDDKFKTDYEPEEFLFVVCNPQNQCFKTKLSNLVEFNGYSVEGLDRLRFGYEYAVAYKGKDGKFYANGAQFIVKKYMEKYHVPSTIYATLKKDRDYIYLQYWFYYAFDPKTPYRNTSLPDPQEVAQHPGDTENLTVVLDKNTKKPLWVFFAHHNNDQKFAYLGAEGEPLFIWNKAGFGKKEGIGGAIVSWNKVEKIKDKDNAEYTHPLVYIALGSHGIYFRKGAYAVDVPNLDIATGNFDKDLFEVAGGGCRLAYVPNLNISNACNNITAKLKIVPEYPIGKTQEVVVYSNNGEDKSKEESNLLYLLSPVNTIGDENRHALKGIAPSEDERQNDVRFFPYSGFFYSEDKLHCLDSTNDSSYDLMVGNVKLKAKNDYCKSILVDKYLFPLKEYLPEEDNLSIKINGNTVKIEGAINPVYWDFKLLPEGDYRLLVNWDVSSENSEWEEIEVFSKTALPTGIKFSSEHTYATSGNHLIGLKLVTPNGAYVEKNYSISIISSNINLSKGLVAYYSFDHCNAKDDSGNGNNGTIHGTPECVNGILGKGLKFGGYYDPSYIEVPNSESLSFLNNFSFVIWFNIQGVYGMDGWGNPSEYGGQTLLAKSGDREGLVVKVGRSSKDGKFYPYLRNGYCCLSSDVYLSAYDENETSVIDLNEWHMLAVVADSQDIKLFIDGKLEAQMSLQEFKINPTMSSSPLRIGIDEGASWYPFNGILDEIRIYDRALTENEILELYKLGKGLSNRDSN